jgi:nucleotide-binding universal stress UspA family protein
MLSFKRILCPTDYSDPSYEALDKASELAVHFNAELGVLHVVPAIAEEFVPGPSAASEYNRVWLAAAREQVCDVIDEHVPKGVKVYPIVCLGEAAEEIERTAEDENADLIVIATHGLTGWRHLVFGSVTEKLLQLAHCPVLVIHAPRR